MGRLLVELDHGPAPPCVPRFAPLVGPYRHVIEVGTQRWVRIAASLTWDRWWDHGAISSRWYTRQTINDDLVLLFYDDLFVFVIILRAKALSLVTNDEIGNHHE